MRDEVKQFTELLGEQLERMGRNRNAELARE